jgi:hypothetical protein
MLFKEICSALLISFSCCEAEDPNIFARRHRIVSAFDFAQFFLVEFCHVNRIIDVANYFSINVVLHGFDRGNARAGISHGNA